MPSIVNLYRQYYIEISCIRYSKRSQLTMVRYNFIGGSVTSVNMRKGDYLDSNFIAILVVAGYPSLSILLIKIHLNLFINFLIRYYFYY